MTFAQRVTIPFARSVAAPLAAILQLPNAVIPDLWVLVLAGGAGRRLASLTGGVPKQFWHPRGGASLLDATLHRVAPLADPAHTVVVVDQAHRSYIQSLSPGVASSLLFQPSDRGTAAGVLLTMMPVLDKDPDATVLITPADHGIRDERRFRHGVLEAVQRARDQGDVVLLATEPTGVNDDYGWILPSARSEVNGFRRVAEFVEKPPLPEATRLHEAGAVWNTMVVVSRVSALKELFRQHLVELSEAFDGALRVAPQERDAFLARVYPTLGAKDFSANLLTPARNLLVYTWPRAIGWSDLGTPERVREWFRHRARAHALHPVDAA